MLDADQFEVRRTRTAEGFRYRVAADGDVALAGTLHPHHLDRDLVLSAPGGDATLRVTPDLSGVDTDVAPGSLDLAFAVTVDADGVVGLVRRDLRSLYRRHWTLLDAHCLEVATLAERSRLLAVARQRFTRLVPYRYRLAADGDDAGRVDGRVLRGYDLAVDPDAVDPRLAVGASLVVDAVEVTT